MTCAAFIADVHVGNHSKFSGITHGSINARCREHLYALENAVKVINTESIDVMIILGDLFDTSRPRPQHILAVQRILQSCKASVSILPGNHDCETLTEADNAIGPLEQVAGIVYAPEIIRYGNIEILEFPFTRDTYGGLKKFFEDHEFQHSTQSHTRLLALHAGITDEQTPNYLKDAPGAISVELLSRLMVDQGISAAFAGDFHNTKYFTVANRTIVQVGALVPTGWNDPGFDYGSIVVFNTAGKNGPSFSRPMVVGPRFIEATTVDEIITAKKRSDTLNCNLYLRVRCTTRDLEEIKAIVKKLQIKHCEILPEGDAGKNLAKIAARAACSKDGLESALAAYIAEMSLTDNTKRSDILCACTEYLKL